MAAQIFQIFYHPSQFDSLDPNFIPYDNTANPRPEWCEYYIFRKEFFKGTCAENITGFLSWKFHDKTGVSGTQCLDWIKKKPGHDVYFINPYAQFLRRKSYKSVWHHGEQCHPGLTPIAQDLMNRAGYDIDLAALIMDQSQTAFCNYWVGTPAFWKRYIDFCEPIYQLIEDDLSQGKNQKLWQPADPSGCCYIPYIFERLFSTLLCADENISSCGMLIDKRRQRPLAKTIFEDISKTLRKIRARISRR